MHCFEQSQVDFPSLYRRLRRVNASAQTDPVHTKLMKEVSTDEPKDLIPMVDEEILTDGNLVIREIGNFILTHSIAQMTESTPTLDVATQTALPRSGISFRKFLDSGAAGDGPAPKVVVIDEAPPSEKAVQQSSSLEELMKIDEKIKQFFRTSDMEALDHLNDLEDHSSSDSIKEQPTPDLLAGSSQDAAQHKPRFLEPPAFNSWQNLDFSDEESEQYVPRDLPRRSIGEGSRPWAEFKDMVIGSRLANMRLSPIPPRRPRPNKKTVTWSDTQHRAVSDLLHEATALVDMFDHVSMLLGPDIKLHSIPPQEDFKLPPPKWEPLLSKSCDLLEEKLAKVRHLTFEDLDEELLLQPPVRTQPFSDLEVTL
nr:uncharacterized protein LOC109403871 [Aedes albopictus]